MGGNCRSCGAVHSRGAAYCWRCGSPLLLEARPSVLGEPARGRLRRGRPLAALESVAAGRCSREGGRVPLAARVRAAANLSPREASHRAVAGGRRAPAVAAGARSPASAAPWPAAPPRTAARSSRQQPAQPGNLPRCRSIPARLHTSRASAPAGTCIPTSAPTPATASPTPSSGPDQPKVPIHFTAYGDGIQPRPLPDPACAPVEGAGEEGDRHVLVLQEGAASCMSSTTPHRAGAGWDAASGAVFNLRSNALRPEGWTSADAAGLPIFPLLVRYDEVQRGVSITRCASPSPAPRPASSTPRRTSPPPAPTPACRRWGCGCG